MPQNGQRCMHYQSKGEFLLNHKKTEGTYSMLNLVKSPCQSNNWVTSDGYWKGHILFVCTFVVMKNIYIYIYIHDGYPQNIKVVRIVNLNLISETNARKQLLTEEASKT